VEPAGLGACLAQCLNKGLAIRVIQEDQLAPVAAIQDVVDRTGILDSQLAGHDGRVTTTGSIINIKTPFTFTLPHWKTLSL
jgi:hypothetical protein